ncbi:hypothetical protein SteCoe_14938 [Stentor coeruleus]|uniref:EF-hand domain-containing protein n=1 Tax=Stentor coeruleus TaxID=5963 RepID=A0A1R2C507_9CILI|nr:hypothetical protein SteCoe_14938 [Stentor coeruleus]
MESANQRHPLSRPSSASHLIPDRELIEHPISHKSFASFQNDQQEKNYSKPFLQEARSTIDYILDNESKLRLIFSMKDQAGRGLLTIEEFAESLYMLENPKITEQVVEHLINATGCKSSNKIYYKRFLESLSKNKSCTKRPTGSVRSDITANYNRISVIPLAKKIWEKRFEITKYSQEGGMRPRVICTASELLSLLKKSAVVLNIHQLKAILRECGFIQASPLDLIKGVRNLLAPETSDVSVFSDIASQASSWVPAYDENVATVKKYLNDYNLQEFFRKASKKNGSLELDDFVVYITQQSKGAVKGFEAEHAFRKAAKGKLSMTENDFCTKFQTSENPRKTELSSMEKVKNWLKINRFSALQGFKRLLQLSSSSNEFMSKDQFIKAVSRLDISGPEAEIFFRLLDTKNDSKLDENEFKDKLYQENTEFNEMRDTIMSYGLDPNEILMKMDLKGKTKLTIDELCLALQRIDSSLNSKKAVEIARSLTGLNSDINVNEFIEKISSHPDANWMNLLLEKVKSKGNYDYIKKLFEDIDQKCMGKIDIGAFADCINKAGLGLNVSEIDKLSRALSRGFNTIDYVWFLEKIRPRAESSDPFKMIISRFLVYLKQNSIRPEDFLTRYNGRIQVMKFAEFLSNKIHKELNKNDALRWASRIDANQDGWIDITDLMCTLDKNREIIEQEIINKDKAGVIIEDIKKILTQKKIGYQEVFNMFDSERNGLISCKEFCEGLDRIMEISPPVKIALFNYFDKKNMGLVDFETFNDILKFNDLKNIQANDTWDWENGTMEKIRTWIVMENVSIEEAFRAFDKDFDGIMSKEDLKKALVGVLKLKEQELSPLKIDRVYKLFDIYKRDTVQLADFKCIFEEKRMPEWRDSAKQAIGLFISKKYKKIHHAFNEISKKSTKITLENFINWVNENQVLTEYRLTNQLLQNLFAYLDPHKKGFLSQEDWNLCLGSFSYSATCLQEVKDAIRSSFSDVKGAFDYFLTFHTGTPPMKISIKDFEKAIENIIPKRFGKKDINCLWKTVFADNSFISFKEFKDIFDEGRYMSNFSASKSKPSTVSSNMATSSYKNPSNEDPLKRLQALIRASPYSIQDIFKEMDTDNSGTISLLEFRNAMRKLNIGLSANDIDGLLARIDTNNDGKIDWQEFQKQFKTSDTEQQIKSSFQYRLNSMRIHMCSFMLSPRDAFNQFDIERSGKLSFNAFTCLVQRLSELAREPTPVFPVIKDLFDIIDIRKDGVLDMREWLNTFKDAEKNTWEDSRQYEDICKVIVKNRKMLMDMFEQVGRGGRCEYEKAKEAMGGVLQNFPLGDEHWRKILGVAIKDNMVDYKTMLDICKQRCTSE